MKIDRRAFTEILAAAGVLAITPAMAQAKSIPVTIKNAPMGSFDPPSVKINVGDTVEWTNPETITHTVTFDPAQAITAADVVLPAGAMPFDSGDLEQDGTFKHTFTVKGTYKYVCKYHEDMGMVGTVIVS